MRKIIAALITLLFLALSATAAAAAAVRPAWHYYREIPDYNGFALIKLDKAVMNHCQDFFADLRITDNNGNEIPCQILQPGMGEISIPVTLLNAADYTDHSSVILDLGANPQAHNRLNLVLDSQKDYLREVRLESSNDKQNWGYLTKGSILYYNKEEKSEPIAYTTSDARYIRVNISRFPGEKALHVRSAMVHYVPAGIYKGEIIETSLVSKRSDRKYTHIVLDLKAPNYFITRVEIKTSNRNFDRNVECFTTAEITDNEQKQMFISNRIWDHQWQGYNASKTGIELQQYAQRYLMLDIYNGSSPPLKISDIKVYGDTPVLLADLHGPARLWYGNSKARLPEYDLAQFAALLENKDLAQLKPGPEKINPDYVPPAIPFSEKHRWLLNAAIILVAAGFIIYILRNLKKMKA
ncbi:DUF3999 family protein [Syntrophomonas palmitatica]|uniref:DUF3999 family protein n=1 Tax=Syntrophomonas palmitatica TaxID=402877 RepID=UPI0006D0A6FA|nr:DUF3999 family protein [Syntrophomonas palmitatica]